MFTRGYHVDPIIVIVPELITTTTRLKKAIISAQLWAMGFGHATTTALFTTGSVACHATTMVHTMNMLPIPFDGV